MNKILFTAVAVLLTLSTAMAQKDPAALQVLDAMSAKYQSIPAFTANFSYIMENEDEGIDEKFEGLITVKDVKYKLIMSGQEIVNDGETVWTYIKDDNEVTISEYDGSEEEISLSNIFTIYKDGYKYLFLAEKDNGKVSVIDLVPEDRDKDFYKIRMEIQKSDNALKNFRIFDKSGSRYLYKINDFKTNSTIKDADFEFNENRYPGVEIVDFR
ncbi:MAG: outer membrane lipoprotein carrier protein LolA [Cyclobacteriaceae bacterium]